MLIQSKQGVHQGPETLAEYGLHKQLQELDWTVTVDPRCHDVSELAKPKSPPLSPKKTHLKNLHHVANVCHHLANVVEDHAKQGELVLTLGGDHSLAMGSITGSLKTYPDLCVIWVDAHADINTPKSTISGHLHGCPVSFLMGLHDSRLSEFSWITQFLKPERLVYIGLRDLDAEEKKIVKTLGIKAFSMTEVDRFGIGNVVEMALNHVNPSRDRPIHLSYDVDALDPSVVPATGTPVRGGLTFREGHYICEAVHETGLLVAMDLVEVNPSLAAESKQLDMTVSVACSLVRSALGETLL
jgi:arginase